MGFLLGGRPGGLYEYSQGVELPLVGSGRFGILRWGNPLYGRDTVEMNYTYTGEKAQIRRLDFDLSCANVTIREGEAFWVRAEKINAKRFRTEVNGDTWEIECDVKNVGRMGGDRAPNITITIPKGFVAEELELDNAMGTMEVRDLAAQQSSILVGMGDLVVKNFSSRDCALEIGMGSLELSGSITGRGSINCGMGSAILALKGEPADYGYTATVGMGSVTIAGKELDTDSNSTPGPWEIDWGAGREPLLEHGGPQLLLHRLRHGLGGYSVCKIRRRCDVAFGQSHLVSFRRAVDGPGVGAGGAAVVRHHCGHPHRYAVL